MLRKISTIGFKNSLILHENEPLWIKESAKTRNIEQDHDIPPDSDIESLQKPLLAKVFPDKLNPSYSFVTNYAGDDDDEDDEENSKFKFILGQLLIGLVNATVLVPTMVGYCSIIFKDAFFTTPEIHAEYFPIFLKLVFISAAIHQLMFILFSSLPFAVGQVQDAGLIFLSSMASTIIQNIHNNYPSAEKEDIIFTVLISLSFSTAFLGVLLYLVGKFKLAQLVQYLPLPVIGGYLAFIGLFCGLSGVRLITSSDGLDNLFSLMSAMFTFTSHTYLLLAPGLVAAVLLFFASKLENNLVLPVALFSFPLIFFLVVSLVSTGSTFSERLEDFRSDGWISNTSEQPSFNDIFSLLNFTKRKIYFDCVFPSILVDFFSMFLIVAFGSCLDVSAIQYELGKELSYNHELKTVGLSNMVSGCLFGYTGSYIFSQSIFSVKNKVTTSLSSCVICTLEVLIVLLPIDILGYLPKFFFSSVLLFVALDLIVDWLYLSYFKLEIYEYVIVLSTFIFINITDLQIGMLVGFILSTLHFSYFYAKKFKLKLVTPHDILVRSNSNEKEKVLCAPNVDDIVAQDRNSIVIFKLNGIQFFGTTQRVINAIKQSVIIKAVNPQVNRRLTQTKQRSLFHQSNILERQDSAEVQEQTEYVILDFRKVSKIDASAARSCFLTLYYILKEVDIKLIFTRLPQSCHDILMKHNVLTIDGIKVFDSIPKAVEYCERKLALRNGYDEGDESTDSDSEEEIKEQKSELLVKYFETVTLSKGRTLDLSKNSVYSVIVLVKGKLKVSKESLCKANNIVVSKTFLQKNDTLENVNDENFVLVLSKKCVCLIITQQNLNKMKDSDVTAYCELLELMTC